jgi:hypothetical protein
MAVLTVSLVVLSIRWVKTFRDRVLSLGERVKLNPPRFGTFLVINRYESICSPLGPFQQLGFSDQAQ